MKPADPTPDPSLARPSFEGMRRWYQRRFTSLPVGIAPFAELFPPDQDYRGGIHGTPARFSGVLRREPGRPLVFRPTEFAGRPPPGMAGERETLVTAEPDRILFSAADAVVYGNHGAVYHPGRRLFVAETAESWDFPFERHPCFARPGFPAAERLTGTSLLLTSLGSQTFYHFFIETMPKLALARDHLEACDHVLISRYGEGWKRRWLEAWGLGGKIRILHELSHIRCDQVLFTNRLVRHFEANPWGVGVLRSWPGLPPLAPASAAEGGETLWFDRGEAHLRRTDWEADMPAALGARSVRFDALAPAEAAAACSRARLVVGLHGAALCNMVFCPPGARVLEVFLKPYYPWYSRLAQTCGLRHRALVLDERTDAPSQIVAAAKQLLAAA
jgi:capsular polysaccharide biosynthesis protein